MKFRMLCNIGFGALFKQSATFDEVYRREADCDCKPPIQNKQLDGVPKTS